jgi:type VI secretion system protein ImpC
MKPELEINLGTKTAAAKTGEPEPFLIAVLGDFSGRGSAQTARAIAIDRDNFDDVMAKLAPSLNLAGLTFSFASLDDFHPDALLRRLPCEAAPAAPAPPPAAPPRSTAGLLDSMLEEPVAAAARTGDLQNFLNQALAGHTVPLKTSSERAVEARANASLSDAMRALLHHSEFQALESAWRGLYFLVRRLETDATLQIHLVDISKRELRDDLMSAKDLRATAFHRLMASNWAVIAGCYTFAPVPEDIELLARIGMIVHQAGAVFLGAASPDVLGCATLEGMPEPRDWRPDLDAAQYWRALRELPEAASIGLLLPRFLLRLPYGKDTSPVETFAFEEIAGAPAHEDYLWGNPAIVAACLLGQAFSEDGWRMRPGSVREVSRLPLHTYQRDGETVLQPCAEAWLSDRAAQVIMDAGVMPLVSARDEDRVLLPRFQSVADPPKALAGRW